MHKVIRLSAIAGACVTLAGCSAASSSLTVPTLDPPSGDRNSAASVIYVAELRVSGSELCPIADYSSGKTLIVSPTGSSASRDPLALVIGGVSLEEGDTFDTGTSIMLPDGFDCGGQHYATALQIHSDVMKYGEETELPHSGG